MYTITVEDATGTCLNAIQATDPELARNLYDGYVEIATEEGHTVYMQGPDGSIERIGGCHLTGD